MSSNNELEKQTFISSLKILASAIPIPFIGELLKESFFEIRGRIKQKRINTFVEELGAYIISLKEIQLNIDQINQDDFGDLFESLLRKVAETGSEKKKLAFRNLMITQLRRPIAINFAELYIRIIAELHDMQIPILITLQKCRYSEVVLLIDEVNDKKRIKQALLESYKNILTADENTLGIIQGRLTNLDIEINNLEDQIAIKGKIPIADDFYLSESEYRFLIQDLCNKGLTMDRSIYSRAEPYSFVEITEVGSNFIDTIKNLEEL